VGHKFPQKFSIHPCFYPVSPSSFLRFCCLDPHHLVISASVFQSLLSLLACRRLFFFGFRSSFNRVICPVRCNLLILKYFAGSVSLYRLYISQLYLPFYLIFSCISPKMHLRSLLWKEPRPPTSFFTVTKVSDAYITTWQGLCNVYLEVYPTYNKSWH